MNLCEALESGRRYNRAIRREIWPEEGYLYATQDEQLMLSSGASPEPTEQDVLADDWETTRKAPYYGPDGVITKERLRNVIQACYNEVGEKPEELVNQLINLFYSLANATIAFTEQPKEETNEKANE